MFTTCKKRHTACMDLKNPKMKKANMITAAAVAAAGIATYFVRRKMRSRKDTNHYEVSHDQGRHLTNVFAKAKTVTRA